MKRVICTALFVLGFAQLGWGQTNGDANLVSAEATAPEVSANSYAVLGATPEQDALVRAQIRVMQPEVLPLRILFVPHWKYIDAARIFHLHVPTGYTSALFTHLPSRSTFVDSDPLHGRGVAGLLDGPRTWAPISNSTKEEDAEKAAREYRKRLKQAHIKAR
jgi:hypothetical protein